eukprot:gb/GEZJ01005650.1/.p1 GENE.gb/GEZJ01005650.1/~~gb/GEZJ01005650.1/.p1  ORF type:complete len:359 (-),score=38.48 gb/GEZJ01005650.1/:109-1185(-)
MKGGPKTESTRLSRALNERMYLIQRVDGGDDSDAEKEEGQEEVGSTSQCARACYLVTGQTGKLYTVSFAHRSAAHTQRAARCNCMDHLMRRTVCKHIMFVVTRVLKAPSTWVSDDARGRAALTQLASRIARHVCAPATSTAPPGVRAAVQRAVPEAFAAGAARRKVSDDEECGICCETLLPDALAFCSSSNGCGRAVHAACMARYANVCDEVRCVLCRAAWVRHDGRDGGARGKRGVLVRGRLVDVSVVVPDAFVRTTRARGDGDGDGDGSGSGSGSDEEEGDDDAGESGGEQGSDVEWTPSTSTRKTAPKRKMAVPKRKAATKRKRVAERQAPTTRSKKTRRGRRTRRDTLAQHHRV